MRRVAKQYVVVTNIRTRIGYRREVMEGLFAEVAAEKARGNLAQVNQHKPVQRVSEA
jgi:hypothetical protein